MLVDTCYFVSSIAVSLVLSFTMVFELGTCCKSHNYVCTLCCLYLGQLEGRREIDVPPEAVSAPRQLLMPWLFNNCPFQSGTLL
jgi:hypothetical protein